MKDLEAQAAGLLFVGFDGKTVDRELERLLARGVSGIVLFSRNVGAAEEVAELVRDAKRRAGRPLLATVDQEGGAVARLREGFTRVPPMRELGATRDADLARETGALVGRELAAVGVDLDFAPVLDVDTNPDNPVIGARSFGSDANLVATLGVAFARGLMDAGVAACGKHFPGHGDTLADSHHELPRLVHAIGRLEAVELVPFRAAVAAGIPSMMTAHVVMEAFDAERPATMSRAVVGGLLRESLGFGGVVFTDDLEMKAIADHYAIDEVVVACLEAGVDAFLCCRHAELAQRTIDAIVRAVRSGALSETRLSLASARVQALVERWASGPRDATDLSMLACDAHRRIVERIGSA